MSHGTIRRPRRRPLRHAACLVVALVLLSPLARAAMFNPATFTLDNGMQVVVVENHRAPVVVHMVWYRVGSADEPPGKSGIAHFLEHLMFKGTERIPPGEFSKIVATNGGRDNAFTADDYTGYFQMVARDKLDLVMGMEADRMTNLVLSDAVVVPEREVVLEERRMRTENSPAAKLGEMMGAAQYLNSPYRLPVIGWAHEIAKLSTEDALAFYRRHYAPDNAILVVAGDVTPDEVKRLAERHYGPIASRNIAKRDRPTEPDQVAARRVVLHSPQVRQPMLVRQYLAPSYGSDDGVAPYALQVLSQIVGGKATSRLNRSIVIEQGAASYAGSSYDPGALQRTTFSLSASPRPGTDMAALEKALDAEIARVTRDGVSAEEVERAKRMMIAETDYARDSLRGAAFLFGRALTSGRSVADVEAWPERVGAVTADDVNKAARALFRPQTSVTGLLLPAEGA